MRLSTCLEIVYFASLQSVSCASRSSSLKLSKSWLISHFFAASFFLVLAKAWSPAHESQFRQRNSHLDPARLGPRGPSSIQSEAYSSALLRHLPSSRREESSLPLLRLKGGQEDVVVEDQTEGESQESSCTPSFPEGLVPENAPSECPGTASEKAGKSDTCAGCPNQAACASGRQHQDQWPRYSPDS